MICSANELTGFYMKATLAFNELMAKSCYRSKFKDPSPLSRQGEFSMNSLVIILYFCFNIGQKEKEPVEFMKKNYAPNFEYPDFAPKFTAEFFNASEWADLVKASGAK